MSIFDEEGLIRESYALAKTALVHYGTKGSQYATIDAVAGGLALFFLASNMAYSDHGRTITKRGDVEQYACLPLLSKCLRLFFPTPKPVSIVCTDAALKNLPASIGGLTRLRTIVVRGNNLTSVPDMSGLKQLEVIDVSGNAITCLPDVHTLPKLKTLNAMNNRLKEVPALPPSLVVLGLKGNDIETIEEHVFERATALEQLYLTDNCLTALPSSIATCRSLRKLQASHNRLTAVPADLSKLPHLELLRLACNELTELPEGLLHSPALAWLSLQGNPLTDSRLRPVKTSTRIIDERELTIGRVLGAGASGEVYEATYRRVRVAYKVFVDDKSPDGDWQDEMKLACIFNHDGLARVIARVRDEHKEIRGFIMEYQDGAPLADRPTQAQLLRCTWAQGRLFDVKFVVSSLLSVSSALEHLHSRCVAHGDVYAHNVLARADGTSILCDYGAAFVYDKKDVTYEKHEVRAFGLLVRDLIERVEISFAEMNAALFCQKQLLVMAQRCLSVSVGNRPRFKELTTTIKKLHKTLKLSS